MASKLRCKIDNPAIIKEILQDFEVFDDFHDNPQVVYEHGQNWINCPVCGGQWAVADTADGFDFDEVTTPNYDSPCFQEVAEIEEEKAEYHGEEEDD
jgi:hypothetical protein